MLLTTTNSTFSGIKTKPTEQWPQFEVAQIDILPASGAGDGGVGLCIIFRDNRTVALSLSNEDARNLAACLDVMAQASLEKHTGRGQITREG
jgi:hypothetical protein